MSTASRVVYELFQSGEFADREIVAFDEVREVASTGVGRPAGNTLTWNAVRVGMVAAGCSPIEPGGQRQIKTGNKNRQLWTGPKAPEWVRTGMARDDLPAKDYALAYEADKAAARQARDAWLLSED